MVIILAKWAIEKPTTMMIIVSIIVNGATSVPKIFSLSEIPNNEVTFEVVPIDKTVYGVSA